MKQPRKSLPAALAGLLMSATVATAAAHPLPTPTPSGYVDTESSVNGPLPDWPDLGRRVKIDLTAYATPSNAIQIAFGQDTNGDEDLEPEETQLVLGVDCGVPFVRNEEGVENRCRCRAEVDNRASLNAGQQIENGDLHSTPTPLLYTFRIKQPSSVSKRISFAKVTTWGREDTAAQIAAEITRPGIVLLLR